MPLPRELQYGFLDRLMSRFRGARDSYFAVAPLRWRLPGARDLHLLPDASTVGDQHLFGAQGPFRGRQGVDKEGTAAIFGSGGGAGGRGPRGALLRGPRRLLRATRLQISIEFC